jgi:hypothetical protein
MRLVPADFSVDVPTACTKSTRNREMKIDENTLHTILKAAMQLERPTTSAIAKATGICECCVDEYMQAAKVLGFVEWVEHAEPTSERAKTDLGWLDWSITLDTVRQFCDDNEEVPLTDEEMAEVFIILHEQFDPYELVVEALHCLRSGEDRYFMPASSSITELAQAI